MSQVSEICNGLFPRLMDMELSISMESLRVLAFAVSIIKTWISAPYRFDYSEQYPYSRGYNQNVHKAPALSSILIAQLKTDAPTLINQISIVLQATF